uniref:Uncharacterized protein n=1 Tax=Oryza sativa subsp. japonica TaxID=39947 RepID=Q69SH5_ORYSJ|nr:hypothetical protein [Oryza sativa Japonica Group]BAD46030.1 hypothetical protein [Oryza sativa Japonica Group]
MMLPPFSTREAERERKCETGGKIQREMVVVQGSCGRRGGPVHYPHRPGWAAASLPGRGAARVGLGPVRRGLIGSRSKPATMLQCM